MTRSELAMWLGLLLTTAAVAFTFGRHVGLSQQKDADRKAVEVSPLDVEQKRRAMEALGP